MAQQEDLHPSILGGIDYEAKFIQSRQRGGSRRVKLKRGDTWLLRFLPARLGPEKCFYVRVARHWLGQQGRPIICPIETEKAMGGNDQGYCPVCEMAQRLNENRDEEISDHGYRLKAQPQWLTYCCVFEKGTADGSSAMPMSEVLEVYEFNHYASTFEELRAFVKSHMRVTPMSIFDYVKGCDFLVTRTGKGTRLDKQDVAPIFDINSPKYEDWIARIEKQLKTPIIKIPSEDAMNEFADKAADHILHRRENGARRRRRFTDDSGSDDYEDAGPRGRGRQDEQRSGRQYQAGDEYEQREERVARQPRAEADGEEAGDDARPSRPQRSREVEEERVERRPREQEQPRTRREPEPERARREPEQDDPPRTRQEPEAGRPVRRLERDEAREEARVERRRSAPPEEDNVPMGDGDQGPGEAEELPQTARTGRKPSTAARRPFEEATPRGSRSAPAPAKSDRIEDDPEELPEEARDAAPPEDRAPRRAPERAAGEQKRSLGSAIRDRVDAVVSREQS